MSRREAQAFAGFVSRTLKGVGFLPLPSETSRSREGLRVRSSDPDRCRVVADLDSDREARDLATAARMALVADDRFKVETTDDAAAFYVRRA